MRNVSLKYVPPSMPGHVFWSNFKRRAEKATEDWTPETIAAQVAATFGIPIADVTVVPFHPDGPPTTYFHTAWAAYVSNEHRYGVEHQLQFLDLMLSAFDQPCRR